MGKQKKGKKNNLPERTLIIEHDSFSFKGKGGAVPYKDIDKIDLIFEAGAAASEPAASGAYLVLHFKHVKDEPVKLGEQHIQHYWDLISSILRVNHATTLNPVIPETEQDMMDLIGNWKAEDERRRQENAPDSPVKDTSRTAKIMLTLLVLFAVLFILAKCVVNP